MTRTDTAVYTDPNRRHDFVLLFDVADGNPNGDPDAGNLPRVDPETMQGLVTDVCLKRKIRNYVEAVRGGSEPYRILIQNEEALNTAFERCYVENSIKKGKKQNRASIIKAQTWMCQRYFDVRLFGAVMSTGDAPCGQVRGPMQMTFGRSYDRVVPLDLTITRMAITKEQDFSVQVSDEGKTTGGQRNTMGRKPIVPYGLYRSYGFFSAHLAGQTGADAVDLALFWEALQNMWELDRSASRGMMGCRGITIFSHENRLGNAPAQALFERVRVARATETASPRSFADYRVTVDGDGLPEGVTLTTLVG
ncbi:MAG: type I-C CRISPR-associated protein Cas7/Csd2 [Anaerolineales bacterium]|nr:type I-C CRISPR-associated protein Cas7/Csd2 [Anaerolineales bacterium]